MPAAERAETYTVTYLEMTARPSHPPAPAPLGQRLLLLRAEMPPPGYFLYLYRGVGDAFAWTDWLDQPDERVRAFVQARGMRLFTLLVEGWPGGFFLLDGRTPGVCDLAYFGLMPEAIGRGLGGWLLDQALREGWALPGVEKMTVNTCTLDHPRALPLYQQHGFAPVRREVRPHRAADPGG